MCPGGSTDGVCCHCTEQNSRQKVRTGCVYVHTHGRDPLGLVLQRLINLVFHLNILNPIFARLQRGSRCSEHRMRNRSFQICGPGFAVCSNQFRINFPTEACPDSADSRGAGCCAEVGSNLLPISRYSGLKYL